MRKLTPKDRRNVARVIDAVLEDGFAHTCRLFFHIDEKLCAHWANFWNEYADVPWRFYEAIPDGTYLVTVAESYQNARLLMLAMFLELDGQIPGMK